MQIAPLYKHDRALKEFSLHCILRSVFFPFRLPYQTEVHSTSPSSVSVCAALLGVSRRGSGERAFSMQWIQPYTAFPPDGFYVCKLFYDAQTKCSAEMTNRLKRMSKTLSKRQVTPHKCRVKRQGLCTAEGRTWTRGVKKTTECYCQHTQAEDWERHRYS